jgi:hypothetical protein
LVTGSPISTADRVKVVLDGQQPGLPPYMPLSSRWCENIDPSGICHPHVYRESTLCGVSTAGFDGHGYSWSPDRPTACRRCAEIAEETDRRWTLDRRDKLDRRARPVP